MRRLLKRNSILLILITQLPTLAARTQEEALRCAQTFFASPSPTATIRKAAPVALHHVSTFWRTNQAEPAFYAFNRGKDEGFVLVAAKDEVPAIIGFADSGAIEDNDLPDNLRDWLSNYQRELDWLEEHPEDALDSNKQTSLATAQASVKPLLGAIKWNQSAPYNNLCPEYTTGKRASAGCVATAAAQVMKYYQHPQQGQGSYTYTTKTLGIQLSADFGNTTYDWTNILDSYSKSYTTTQASAIATLMYHVGVSCSMNYSSSGGSSSSAYMHMMGYALKTYFQYDASLRVVKRDYYAGDWNTLIRSELNAGRPVIYDGYGSGGHCFVCDGYNAEGYFHFNWGWAGKSDGYFLLTLLMPSDQGIGGSGSAYSFSQGAIVGIQPDQGGSAPEIAPCTYRNLTVDKTSFSSSDKVTFTAQFLQNNSVDTISTGNLAVLVMQNNQIKTRLYLSGTESNLAPSYYFSKKSFKGATTYLEDGTYDVTLGYWQMGYTYWQLVNGRGGTPYYYTLVVKGTSRTLTAREKNSCIPQLQDLLHQQMLVEGIGATIKPLVFLPATHHAYRDSMRLVLKRIDTQAIGYDSKAYYVDLAAGRYDSTAITISSMPAAGDYRVLLYHSVNLVDSLATPVHIYAKASTVHNIEVWFPLRKVMKDGKLLIYRDNEVYTIEGRK